MKLTPNVGSTDRIIRIVLAVVLGGLYFLNVVSGTLGLVLLAVAVILLATSAVSFCPIYSPFKISTRGK